MEREKQGFRPCPNCGKGVLAVKPLTVTADLLMVRCESCGRTVTRADFRELTDAWNNPENNPETEKNELRGWFA